MKKLFDNALLCLWRALLFSPIILIAGGLLPGASQLSAGLYYAAGQLLALAMSFVPARGRVAVMILAGAAYAAAGVFALGALEAPFVFIIVALSLTMYALSVHAEGAGEYDPRLMIAGAIIHAGAPLVIKLSGEQMNYTAMMWAGIVFLMMCPYVMNNTSVRSGMSLRGRGGRPIKRISRANRVMVTVMLAIALMIAGAEAIRAAAQRAGSFVMYWVGQFIWWLMSLMPGESGGGGMGGGAPDDLGLGMETAEPSWFAQLLEQVMRYFVVAVLIAGAAFVLWKLGKVLIRLMRKLSEWAKQFAQGVKEDYLEEREQLMDWGEVRGEMMESVKEALRKFTTREKKWGELDARERVRYVMRQLYRKRGVAVSGLEYMSARQALDEMDMDDSVRAGLGELYDRARYSDHEVTEAQAEEARRVTK